jgi:hypothetical protein
LPLPVNIGPVGVQTLGMILKPFEDLAAKIQVALHAF